MISSVLLNGAMVAVVLLVLLLGLTAWRLLRGPDIATRFVALDMLTGLAVALLAVTTIVMGRNEFLDVALGVAAFSFVGTVAVGAFLQRHEGRKE